MRSIISTLFAVFLMAVASASTLAQQVSSFKDHDPEQPLDIAADHWELQQKDGRALFNGHVEIIQGGMTLKCQTLTAFYKMEEGNDNPTFNRLDINGNVSVTSSVEEITSEWGIYDVEHSLITLGGNVRIVRGDTVLTGTHMELNLITGITKLDGGGNKGRVRGSFKVPKKDTGEEKTSD